MPSPVEEAKTELHDILAAGKFPCLLDSRVAKAMAGLDPDKSAFVNANPDGVVYVIGQDPLPWKSGPHKQVPAQEALQALVAEQAKE